MSDKEDFDLIQAIRDGKPIKIIERPSLPENERPAELLKYGDVLEDWSNQKDQSGFKVIVGNRKLFRRCKFCKEHVHSLIRLLKHTHTGRDGIRREVVREYVLSDIICPRCGYSTLFPTPVPSGIKIRQ